MGSDGEPTGGTARSDQMDSGSEGDAGETASDAAPDVVQGEGAGAEAGAGVAAASGGSDLTEKPAEDAEVDAKKKKKKKKKDLGIGTSRGVETMFRTSYRVHQDLVGIADAKANIMISVNGFIIAVTMPLAPQIFNPQIFEQIARARLSWLLPLATGVLLIGCVAALVYAVLAATPRVSNVRITLEDIARNEANILFFGHFVKLSESDYVQGMRDLMESQDLLYVNMVRDLYHLGLVLDKKFRLLRISYTVFLVTLVVGVALFVTGFIDAATASVLRAPQDALPLLPQ